jgi:hypothetical protein
MRTLLCVFVGSVLLTSTGIAADQDAHKSKRTQDNQAMSDDMREAIAFQRAKDRADARQAAIEAKHPTVFHNQAERSTDEDSDTGNKVLDPGPRPVKK